MRDNRTLLPMLCSATLLLALVMQLVLTGNTELPDDISSGGRPRTEMPAITGQFVPPILLARPMFSPVRTANNDTDQVAQAPLGGAFVAGAVSINGKSYAVVQRPDGGIIRLAIGAGYAGWRLQSLSSTGAMFGQGKQRISMIFGVAPGPIATQTAENEEE
jgi:hypothetical protein